MTLTDDRRTQLLGACRLFTGLPDDQLREIAAAAEEVEFPRGRVIARQGEVGTGFFVVESGAVRVVRDGEELAVLGPGEFFGELSLLFETTHSKTALAVTDTELMAIPKESFHSLMAANPDVAEIVRRKAEERYPARAAELSRLP